MSIRLFLQTEVIFKNINFKNGFQGVQYIPEVRIPKASKILKCTDFWRWNGGLTVHNIHNSSIGAEHLLSGKVQCSNVKDHKDGLSSKIFDQLISPLG